jgi:hypothetical protein
MGSNASLSTHVSTVKQLEKPLEDGSGEVDSGNAKHHP